MKKLICIVACFVLAIGMVSAGGEKQKDTSSGKKQPTITLLLDVASYTGGISAVMEAAAAKFGVELVTEFHSGGADGDNINKTRLASGDMADMFMVMPGAMLQALNPERNMVDLTNEPWMAQVTDSFKTAASINGRVYAVPGSTSAFGGWLYNKRVYRELGLAVPHTWKDLLANLEKAQAAGKIALIGAYKETWTTQLIILADEYNIKTALPNFPADYTANKLKIATTPIALRSFEKLAETRKYLNKDFLATTNEQALEMLATGQGVHYPLLSTGLTYINDNYPEYINDIGFFGQPGDDPNKHGATVWESGSGAWAIYKNSPNVEICKKILEFCISQEGINIFSSKQKPDGPYSIKGIALPKDVFPALLEMQQYFDTGKVAPALEFESPIKGPNLEQICVEVGAGITEPKAAAAAYDADVQKQAIQLNLPGW